MLVEPSEEEFKRTHEATGHAGPDTYDMEIMNDLYYESCIVLPHRPYDLLTCEFRNKDGDHTLYLGNDYEQWKPLSILEEAKFPHFSDWPVLKPWVKAKEEVVLKRQPDRVARFGGDTEPDCTERHLWRQFYDDFARRRKEIRGMDWKL